MLCVSSFLKYILPHTYPWATHIPTSFTWLSGSAVAIVTADPVCFCLLFLWHNTSCCEVVPLWKVTSHYRSVRTALTSAAPPCLAFLIILIFSFFLFIPEWQRLCYSATEWDKILCLHRQKRNCKPKTADNCRGWCTLRYLLFCLTSISMWWSDCLSGVFFFFNPKKEFLFHDTEFV